MRFAPTPVNDFIYRYDELPEEDVRYRKHPTPAPKAVKDNGYYQKTGSYKFGRNAGMETVAKVRHEEEEEEVIPPDKIVGSFGIVDDNGHEIKINWVVGGTRTDGKHGYVGDVAYHNNHTISLLETMFKGW